MPMVQVLDATPAPRSRRQANQPKSRHLRHWRGARTPRPGQPWPTTCGHVAESPQGARTNRRRHVRARLRMRANPAHANSRNRGATNRKTPRTQAQLPKEARTCATSQAPGAHGRRRRAATTARRTHFRGRGGNERVADDEALLAEGIREAKCGGGLGECERAIGGEARGFRAAGRRTGAERRSAASNDSNVACLRRLRLARFLVAPSATVARRVEPAPVHELV
mmetsp:Transcript_707/g.1466  ORF Transcript_707/g.1466 Transcript_707/m.1466 type:complete len:224 (-) Transcript_707:208-879(-)